MNLKNVFLTEPFKNQSHNYLYGAGDCASVFRNRLMARNGAEASISQDQIFLTAHRVVRL